jgi:HTH-type transcriptional regulator/antitoxin HigA
VDFAQFRTPGQLIDALLSDRNWTKRVLAIVLGVDEAVVTRMVADKRAIDATMALQLGEVFGIAPEEFINRQAALDLHVARYKIQPDPTRATRAALFGDLPVADMIKRGWLSATLAHPKSVETELTKFFGVADVNEIEVLPHAAKKTDVFTPVSPAQMAWLYRAKQIASDMLVGRYSPTSARAAVDQLKALRPAADEIRHVPRILTEHGIRFLLIETLPTAKIDGVCFWLNDMAPVIAMSMRHDRIDNFWFVLRHECEHVIQRHGRGAVMIDFDLDGSPAADIADEERAANAAAAEFCVPQHHLENFIARKAPIFAERDLLGFARTIKVHPGLVAGQIRRRTGRYNVLSHHLVKVRSIIAPNAVKDGWGDVAPVD